MTEEQIQKKVATHFLKLEAALQNFTFFAVAGGSVRLPIHIAKRLKDMGVRAGITDLVFLGKEAKSVFIELKTFRDNGYAYPLSKNQKNFFAVTQKLGHVSAKVEAKDDKDAINQIESVLRAHGVMV